MPDYREMNLEDVESMVRTIVHTSDSEDEVRRRIGEELGYPHSLDSITVDFMRRGMARVMMWGPNCEVLNL